MCVQQTVDVCEQVQRTSPNAHTALQQTVTLGRDVIHRVFTGQACFLTVFKTD